MIHDAIVDDVRSVREQLAARFDFDIHRIMEDARRRQSQYGARLVSLESETPATHVTTKGESEPTLAD